MRRKNRQAAANHPPFDTVFVPSVRAMGGVRLIEVAAAVATLILFAGAVFGLHGDVWAVVIIVWLLTITTGAVVYAYSFQQRHRRRIRFAAMAPSIHQVHHLLRDATSAIVLRNAGLHETRPMVIDALSAVAQVFTGMFGATCRACIKEVTWPASVATPVHNADDLRDLQVSTFCRDGATGTKPGDDRAAEVNQNTHFEVLFLHRDRYRWFHCNDLERLKSYKNSNWPDDPNDDQRKDYLSTCVWPIQKTDKSGGDCHDTVAFLCVDTRETGRINDRFDFWIGAAFADALYPVLKLMRLQAAGKLAHVASAQQAGQLPGGGT